MAAGGLPSLIDAPLAARTATSADAADRKNCIVGAR